MSLLLEQNLLMLLRIHWQIFRISSDQKNIQAENWKLHVWRFLVSLMKAGKQGNSLPQQEKALLGVFDADPRLRKFTDSRAELRDAIEIRKTLTTLDEKAVVHESSVSLALEESRVQQNLELFATFFCGPKRLANGNKMLVLDPDGSFRVVDAKKLSKQQQVESLSLMLSFVNRHQQSLIEKNISVDTDIGASRRSIQNIMMDMDQNALIKSIFNHAPGLREELVKAVVGGASAQTRKLLENSIASWTKGHSILEKLTFQAVGNKEFFNEAGQMVDVNGILGLVPPPTDGPSPYIRDLMRNNTDKFVKATENPLETFRAVAQAEYDDPNSGLDKSYLERRLNPKNVSIETISTEIQQSGIRAGQKEGVAIGVVKDLFKAYCKLPNPSNDSPEFQQRKAAILRDLKPENLGSAFSEIGNFMNDYPATSA